MKKITLALMTMLILSCKKETTPPEKLPAIQKIRQSALKEWEVSPEKSLMQIPITFNEKLKPEFANFDWDSNIVVSVRVKFEGQDEEHLLPYSVNFLGGVKHYFYTLSGGKPRILFQNSTVCDFSSGGGSSALPMEQVSFNFTKITFE